MKSNHRAALAAIALTAITVSARAQQSLPSEVISATPLTVFSSRAGLWPSNVISQPDFANQPVEQTLNTEPGVQARQAGSPTISIRGSASADRVLQLYEGIPINLGDGLGASNLFLPAESIGSVHVFKGPASVFYGSSAMAGAVDFRQRLFARPAFRLITSSNEFGLDTQNIFAAAPFAQGRSQITAVYDHGSGRYPYTSVSGFGSGVREHGATETSRMTAAGDYHVGSWWVRPRFLLARSLGEAPGPLNAPFTTNYDDSGWIASVAAELKVDAETEFSIRLADVRQWGLFDRGTTYASTSFSSRSVASADLHYRVVGPISARTFVDDRWDRLAASYLGDATLTQNEFEIGQVFEASLTPTLILQPMVRYHAASGDWFKALALVHADSEARRWLSYGEGFRAASLSDRFADVSYFKGNASLQPERSRSLELGFEHNLEDFHFGATLFTVRYENLFDSVAVSPLATSKVNAGSARAQGAEFFTSYARNRALYKAAYAFLDAQSENGDPLRLSPRHQITMSVGYEWRTWFAELKDTSWSAFTDREMPSNAIRGLPGWSMWDLSLASHHLKDWEIKASLLNLFNAPRELTYAFPEPQRRLTLSALRSF